MASTPAAAGCCPSVGNVYNAAMAFMNGPDFIVVSADEGGDLEKALQGSVAAAKGAPAEPVVEVVLASRSSADPVAANAPVAENTVIKLGKPPALRAGGYQCTSALGSQLRGKTIEGFDKNKQVYTKQELSPLPFQPPVFMVYATAMLSGAFKVFQYVMTIMVALMVTQHAIERFWSMAGEASKLQLVMFVIFLSYPLITLLLVILSNNEMAVRRFMYYRLMSLQVIIDWQNVPFWRLWFFWYFAASFVLINVYSLYAGVLTKEDKTTSVFPQWSIMVMQSVLLFMFWLSMVSMEEQLVSLNKVIENSPNSAKELITRCDVITESQLKAVISKTYRRKRVFKKMTAVEQDESGRQLLENGDSSAAFFDLNALRKTSRNRTTQEDLTADQDGAAGGCFGWLWDLKELVDDLTFRKLYAWYFALPFFSVSLYRFRRSGSHRSAASLWPYAGDTIYFMAMGTIGSLCFLTIAAVEVYAIWFLLFATDISDRDKYGILECKQCYQYHMTAGDTCQSKPASDACWAAAKLGYCAVQDAMANSYGLNATEVQALNGTSCASFVPVV